MVAKAAAPWPQHGPRLSRDQARSAAAQRKPRRPVKVARIRSAADGAPCAEKARVAVNPLVGLHSDEACGLRSVKHETTDPRASDPPAVSANFGPPRAGVWQTRRACQRASMIEPRVQDRSGRFVPRQLEVELSFALTGRIALRVSNGKDPQRGFVEC